MGKPAVGSITYEGTAAYVRVTFAGARERPMIRLYMAKGDIRIPLVARLVNECAIGLWGSRVWTIGALKRELDRVSLAAASAPDPMAAWREIIDSGALSQCAPTVTGESITFSEFAASWLHGEYPELTPPKRWEARLGIMRKHIFPALGHLPLASITYVHWEDFERRLAAGTAWTAPRGVVSTRRHPRRQLRDKTRMGYWMMAHHIMQLALDKKYVTALPVASRLKPKIKDAVSRATLWPSDDAALMACHDVPVGDRMIWGILAREGMRLNELLALHVRDMQPNPKGVGIEVYRFKTSTVGRWMLSPDVARALEIYHHVYVYQSGPDTPLVESSRERSAGVAAAAFFRRDLRSAGCAAAHPALFVRATRPGESDQVTAHDLRSLFVTLALLRGEADGYIRDHTGHTTAQMIEVYKANGMEITNRGEPSTLAPLWQAIPELAAQASMVPTRLAQVIAPRHADPTMLGSQPPVVEPMFVSPLPLPRPPVTRPAAAPTPPPPAPKTPTDIVHEIVPAVSPGQQISLW